MIHVLALVGQPPEHRSYRFSGNFPGLKPWIADSAIVEAFATIDAGIEKRTRVESEAYVMKHAHVGHDAQIGARCDLAPGCVIGGHVVLEEGAKVGIGAVIRPRVRVGAGARIGAGAVVVRDVPAGETWVGNPAHKLWKPEQAPTIDDPAGWHGSEEEYALWDELMRRSRS